jgi:hypothetical protein
LLAANLPTASVAAFAGDDDVHRCAAAILL